MASALTDQDIERLSRSVLQKIEAAELSKVSKSLIDKGHIIAPLNCVLKNNYPKLAAASTIDIRYLALIMLAKEITSHNIEGSIAELGVYRGVFAQRIRALLPGRKFYLFDSFKGFNPKQKEYDEKKYLKTPAPDFSKTSQNIALKTIGDTASCVVKKGFFPDTAQDVNDDFAFVSLDVYLYQPTLDGLQFFYEHLVPGGYILVHCYGDTRYPGCGAAVREFCDQNKVGCVPLPDQWVSAVITKSRDIEEEEDIPALKEKLSSAEDQIATLEESLAATKAELKKAYSRLGSIKT
jgi:O-methyltransferase